MEPLRCHSATSSSGKIDTFPLQLPQFHSDFSLSFNTLLDLFEKKHYFNKLECDFDKKLCTIKNSKFCCSIDENEKHHLLNTIKNYKKLDVLSKINKRDFTIVKLISITNSSEK